MSQREEGWYRVTLPYFDGHTSKWVEGPWVCMQYEYRGWWFDEQDKYIQDVDLYDVGDRIYMPDEA